MRLRRKSPPTLLTTKSKLLKRQTRHTMKRKLDASNVPTVQPLDQPDQSVSGFAEYGLDPRLLQALVKEKFRLPTPVQAKAIPLALEGKDILGI